jgi:hypothetical protein
MWYLLRILAKSLILLTAVYFNLLPDSHLLSIHNNLHVLFYTVTLAVETALLNKVGINHELKRHKL